MKPSINKPSFSTMKSQPARVNQQAFGSGSQGPFASKGIQQLTPDELREVNAGVLIAIPFLVVNPGFAAGVLGGAAIMSRILR